jgi:8-oxo-dGTP diphosphatase
MDGSKILLAKRKREPYKGYYGILGGRQTFGEEMRDIAKREVREETGYTIKDDMHVKGTYSEILLGADGKPRDHFLFVVIRAMVDHGVRQLSELENTDIEKFRWFGFPLSQSDRKRVIPTDLLMLENFDSDEVSFKEFVMREIPGPPDKVEILKVIDEK